MIQNKTYYLRFCDIKILKINYFFLILFFFFLVNLNEILKVLNFNGITVTYINRGSTQIKFSKNNKIMYYSVYVNSYICK